MDNKHVLRLFHFFFIDSKEGEMDSVLGAQDDEELFGWLQNVIHGNEEQGIPPAGDFLKNLATAALHADWENYKILRLTLLQFREKYPKYKPNS